MRKWYFGTAFFSFLLTHVLMLVRVEPIATYFYVFVWWSYILTIDSLIFWHKGNSLIYRLKARVLLLIISSYLFWEFFELINIRIANWAYVGSPVGPNGVFSTNPAWRFGFKFLAFGSVLPGILETHEFLQFIGLGRRLEFLGWEKSRRFLIWKWWGRPSRLWGFLGLIMLIIPLVWPQYFFWTIWLAIIFLLDPSIEKLGGKSLFSELRKGNVRTFYRLLLTGLICGVLWEGWNYWVGLKWTYDVPFVGDWKIFEMPILGYLGFSLFAVECYIFYEWLMCQWRRLKQLTSA